MQRKTRINVKKKKLLTKLKSSDYEKTQKLLRKKEKSFEKEYFGKTNLTPLLIHVGRFHNNIIKFYNYPNWLTTTPSFPNHILFLLWLSFP